MSFGSCNKKSRPVWDAPDDDENPSKRKRLGFDELEESDDEPPQLNNDKTGDNSDEEDPLDAFMTGIHEEAQNDYNNSLKKASEVVPGETSKPLRTDIEEHDEIESFFQFVKEKEEKKASHGTGGASANRTTEEVQYDSDDNPIITIKEIVPHTLPDIDHSKMEYYPFEKCFYEESEEITNLPQHEINHMLRRMEIKVKGADILRPIRTFEQCGFDKITMKEIAKRGYKEPMDIQKQVLPIVLSGRDIVGVAKTGSGKTLAFVWPMIMHILDQPFLEKGDGPIAIILAPTRELASQIYAEAKKFCKPHGIRVASIVGGQGKFEQFKELKNGAEVVVGTPGRMIDLVKMKAFDFMRTTYLVLDEADRMFDLGFEPQVRSICNSIRPDRQTLLFSATFRSTVEQLSADVLDDVVKVTMGEVGQANKDIVQIVHVFSEETEKLPWLAMNLRGFVETGQVLIFVGMKTEAEELAGGLIKQGFRVGCIHGDMGQASRNEMMKDFKAGVLPVLVATDIAARGLDIRSVRTVINFSKARNIEAHIHRVGRTGRAGEKGVAYTLITDKEMVFAGQLVHHLENCEQNVPQELLTLALKNPRFRKFGHKYGVRSGGGRGGRGRGGGGRGRGDNIAFGRFGKGTYSAVPPPPMLSGGQQRSYDLNVGQQRGYNQQPACNANDSGPVFALPGNRQAQVNQFRSQFVASTSNPAGNTSLGATATPPQNPQKASSEQMAKFLAQAKAAKERIERAHGVKK